jgi:tRNA (cmo5U34)-methyltransferase
MEQQSMIVEIGQKFWQPGTNIYDLGCSTAFTLINLCRVIPGPASFIGFDNSPAMLEQAKKKIESREGMASRIELHHGDLNGDLDLLPLTNASVVTLCWTLQFVRPLCRDELIQWIYQGLIGGGVLVVTEKVLTNSGPMNRFFIEFYCDFKAKNGYSWEEIMRKREALENVLIPYRLEENLELFRRNGFEIVETFFQWYNFAGFLCVKKNRG